MVKRCIWNAEIGSSNPPTLTILIVNQISKDFSMWIKDKWKTFMFLLRVFYYSRQIFLMLAEMAKDADANLHPTLEAKIRLGRADRLILYIVAGKYWKTQSRNKRSNLK